MFSMIYVVFILRFSLKMEGSSKVLYYFLQNIADQMPNRVQRCLKLELQGGPEIVLLHHLLQELVTSICLSKVNIISLHFLPSLRYNLCTIKLPFFLHEVGWILAVVHSCMTRNTDNSGFRHYRFLPFLEFPVHEIIHYVFQSGHATLHSHQQCMKVLVPPYFIPHAALSVFLITAILDCV